MLKRILAEKLELIQHPEDIYFKEALKAIYQKGLSPSWRNECTQILTRLLSRIALEENVSPFDEDESEILFKHHLPDFITGIIQALEEILFIPPGPEDAHSEATDFETALHLLLRLLEWMVWNYEGGRCIYGRVNAEKAESLFQVATFELEVWGDRDEVWLTVLDILKGQFHLGASLEAADTYYSCRTYSSILKNLPRGLAQNEAYWASRHHAFSPVLIISVQSRIVDQTWVKIILKDIKDPHVKSSGVLEGDILGRIASICGTPFEEPLLH